MNNKEVHLRKLMTTLVASIVLAAIIWSAVYLLPKPQNQLQTSGSVTGDQTSVGQNVSVEISRPAPQPDAKIIKQVRGELGTPTKPVASSTRDSIIKVLSK